MSRPQWPDSPNSLSDDPGTIHKLRQAKAGQLAFYVRVNTFSYYIRRNIEIVRQQFFHFLDTRQQRIASFKHLISPL